jgi:hypothetical protein
VRTAPLVLAVAGALAVGCGSSSDEGNPEDFLGVWTASGTTNTRCGMGAGTAGGLEEVVTITQGVGAPLLVVVGSCSLQMDIHGKMAVVRPGQMCTLMRNGISSTATYSSGDFSVSGIKATFNLNASFTVGDGALVLSCSYMATGTASKMPK